MPNGKLNTLIYINACSQNRPSLKQLFQNHNTKHNIGEHDEKKKKKNLKKLNSINQNQNVNTKYSS